MVLIHNIGYPFQVFFGKSLQLQSQGLFLRQGYRLRLIGLPILLLHFLSVFGLFGFWRKSSPPEIGRLYPDGGVRVDFEIVLLELAGQLEELGVVFVEVVAVLDDFIDVCVELGRRAVKVVFQVVFDGGEVHGLLDDLQVVRDTLGDGIHRLLERP